MKRLLTVILGLLATGIHAAPEGQVIANAAAAELNKQKAIYAEEAEEQAIKARLNAAMKAEWMAVYTRDPWRVIDGVTNRVGGPGWYQFQGVAKEFKPEGIIFKGQFGNVLSIRPERTAEGKLDYGEEPFLVEHFPYPTDDVGFGFMLARFDGNYTYTNLTTNGLTHVITIKKFDYCTPCVKIWSKEEIEARDKKRADEIEAAAQKSLKKDQEAAAGNDALGLQKMGVRHMTGDHVPKDFKLARNFFERAKAAGNFLVEEDLNKLSQLEAAP